MSNESFLSRALNYLLKHKEQSNGANHEKENPITAGQEGERDTEHTDRQTSTSDQSAADPNPSNMSATSHSGYRTYVDQKSLFTPANVMRAIGVEILEDGEDGYYLVAFQGGAFVFFFEEDRLNVMYNDVVECTFADSLKATFVANDINGEYSVWSCYMRAAKRGSAKKPVKVCFSQMFPLVGNFQDTVTFIHGVLSSAFSIAREFREKFKEALEDKSDLANTLNRKDLAYKLELTKRSIELGNFDNEHEELPPTSYLQLSSFLDFFNDSEFGVPVSLTVFDETPLVITDVKKIQEFNIRTFIREHPKRDTLDRLNVLIHLDKQDLIIYLKKMPGSSEKSLFYTLCVMRSGTEGDTYNEAISTNTFRDTIEIRLTTEQEDYWEVKFLIDDAHDKQKKNDFSSLTEEQKMLLVNISPSVQDDLYWGVKFFNDEHWYQALFYFTRIFYYLNRQDESHKRNEDMVSNICYYIGLGYLHLHLYDRAFYYLDRGRRYSDLGSCEWYVDCLCLMKDPLAYKFLKREMNYIAGELEDLEDESNREALSGYFNSLRVHFVRLLIDELRLDEAEKFLKRMMREQDNFVFAEKQLNRIKEIRELKEQMKSELLEADAYETDEDEKEKNDEEENHKTDEEA